MAAFTSPHQLRTRLPHRVTATRQYFCKKRKFSQQGDKDFYDWKTQNVPLSFTTGKYVHVNRQPVTTSPSQRLATELYNKMIRLEVGKFRIVKISPSMLKINEERKESTSSTEGAKPAPLAKIAQQNDHYSPIQPVYKWDDQVDAGEGQPREATLSRRQQ